MSGAGCLAIVCDALRAPALTELAQRFDIAAVVARRRRFDLPDDVAHAADLDAALRAGARGVAILSPGGDLQADVGRCVAAGVPVVAAGPAGAGGVIPWVPGRGRCHLAVARAHARTETAAFGQPVYLRWLGGGGNSAAGAWWSLLEGLDVATHLLGGPPARGWITARTEGRRWHVVATVITASQASAQLVVTPTAHPGDEFMLLGTGGLVQSEGARDAAVVQDAAGDARLLRLEPSWPDADWLVGALSTPQPPSEAELRRARACLRALRQAARQGRPIPLPV